MREENERRPGGQTEAATSFAGDTTSLKPRTDIPGLTNAQAAIVAGWLDAPKQSPAAPLAFRGVDEPLTGIDRAIANASPWDVDRFKAAVRARAALPGEFLIEDAVADLGEPLDHPGRPGALTAALAREGVIVRVGYRKAKRATRSGGVSAVWVGAEHSSGVDG